VNVLERRLTSTLGLSRNQLREHREKFLIPEKDFFRESRNIVWTPDAVLRIRDILMLPKNGAPVLAPLPDLVTLHVWLAKLVNTKIILAHKPGADPEQSSNLLRVRVRSSAGFMRYIHGLPMAITARLIEGDLYEFVGKYPKARKPQ
jgi:hypothetical protein